MTSLETSQGFAQIENYRMNITARYDTVMGDDIATKALIESTIKLWLYVAKLIHAGERKTAINSSPEDRMVGPGGVPLELMPLSEPRVTVWCDVLAGEGFTVHSHSKPQDALNIFWARHDAVAAFAPAIPPQATPTPKPQENASSANVGANTGNPPPILEGVIAATRAPNPKEVLYADGQLVSFEVNKIVMGTNNGSVTYALWGPLGARFPLKTIYKTRAGSDANSPDYIAMKDLIVSLNLSIDTGKFEATGNWLMVCKAAHVPQPDGSKKEYLNIQAPKDFLGKVA